MEKDFIISIQDLLKGRNRNAEFDAADEKRIKLIRHSGNVMPNSMIYKDYDGPVYKLYHTNYELFLKWQQEQADSRMKNVDYLIVFLAEEGCECRFIGVFKNNGFTHSTMEGVSVYDIGD